MAFELSKYITIAFLVPYSLSPGEEEFEARMEIVIKKRNSVKITVDEVWVSEKEMRDELKWTAYIGSIHLPYIFFCFDWMPAKVQSEFM